MFTWILGSKLCHYRARAVSPRRTLFARRALAALLVAMVAAAGLVHPIARAALPPVNATETAAATAPASRKHTIRPRLSEAYAKLPVSFEANLGQTDSRVKFIARGHSYSLALTATEAIIQLRNQDQKGRKEEGEKRRGGEGETLRDDSSISLSPYLPVSPSSLQSSAQSATVSLKFIGATSAAKITGVEPLPGRANYLVGNDPTQWRGNIPTYAKVRCEGIYPGIDAVYYGNHRRLKYDLVVAPGANPKTIAFEVEGAARLSLDREGALVARTPAGDFRQEKPFIYQETGGVKREVVGRFVLLGKRRVGFNIGRYDRSKALVIDPQITTDPRVKSAFKFGGSDDDSIRSIAVDSQGGVYVIGGTRSTDFPTMNPVSGARRGTGDAFVTKLNPEGTQIVYSTYLGGSDFNDTALDIAVDSAGNAYVAGVTGSNDFPTTAGALQTIKAANNDAYIVKLNPSGNGLVYSTFLGGSRFETASSIAVDADGNAYVTGNTDSSNFPTMNAFQPALGGTKSNAFISKVNAAGSGLIYSTYLGGIGSPTALNGDVGSSIALGSDLSVYVAGVAFSRNFPTTAGAFQTSHGGDFVDAFVTKLNSSGALGYSTYLGGSGNDTGVSIAVDSSGNAYVTGGTLSPNFPVTAGAFQTALRGGTGDAYVTKLNATGTALVYSTYIAGTGGEVGASIAVDEQGNVYVIGTTTSPDFPMKDPLQSALNGPNDAFVTALNAAGSDTVFSTYIGGSDNETGAAIAISGDMVYAAGSSRSSSLFAQSFGQSAFTPQAETDDGYTFTFVDRPRELTLTKRAVQFPGVVNQDVTYEIRVRNRTLPPQRATNITITDFFRKVRKTIFGTSELLPSPSDLPFIIKSVNSTKGQCRIVERQVLDGQERGFECTVNELNPDEEVVITFIVCPSPGSENKELGNLAVVRGMVGGNNRIDEDRFIIPINLAPPPEIESFTREGKKITINGKNFQEGAKVLIDGEEQTTTNDEANPSTKLKAKGKKIKRLQSGQSVKVINPDGQSDEVIF